MKQKLLSVWRLEFALTIILCSVGVALMILATNPPPYRGLSWHLVTEYTWKMGWTIMFGGSGLVCLCLGIYMADVVRVSTEALIRGDEPNYQHPNRVLFFLILIMTFTVLMVNLGYHVYVI
jgi:hypothetical protein